MKRADYFAAWLQAKREEEAAKKKRFEIEQIMLVRGVVDFNHDGSKTTTADGYKVTVKMGMNYRLDAEAWDELSSKIPAELHPTKIKTEIDVRKYKALENNDPELWAVVAACVTATPAKPGFTIKEVE